MWLNSWSVLFGKILSGDEPLFFVVGKANKSKKSKLKKQTKAKKANGFFVKQKNMNMNMIMNMFMKMIIKKPRREMGS